MNPFSKIFVVNLDNEVGKKRLSVLDDHFKEHGIPYERFDATEIKENGAMGLNWTMKRLFWKCIEEELTNVLVFEDDTDIRAPFWPFIEEVWPQLPKDYHCLCLGTNLLAVPVRKSENILRVRSSYATHAIVYSLEAMKLILPLLENKLCLPFDITLMKEIQPLQKTYCTFPMLAFQRPGYSSIEKKQVDWATHSAFTFRAHTAKMENTDI